MSNIYIKAINQLLSQFNLEWNKIGLKYKHKTLYGSIDFFVTKDLNKTLKFLGLVESKTTGYKEIIDLISCSKFFNKKLIRLIDEPKYDLFVRQLRSSNVLSLYKGTNILNEKIKYIDKFFGSNIKQRIDILDKAGLNKREIRNKFNGKLVMHWTGIKPGPLLFQTLEDFKTHIEKTFQIGFLDFITNSTPRMIKLEFLKYYNHLDYVFDNGLDLPF